MLETIQQLETTLAEQIKTAKQEAATMIQVARTEAADGRVALEERLRAEEQQLIAEAEAKATKESDALISGVTNSTRTPDKAEITQLAKQLITPLIS